MTTYAIAASAVLVIAVVCFFIFRDGEIQPPGDGGNVDPEVNITIYTKQELEKKSVDQMDEIVNESEEGNIKCHACGKVRIGKFDYDIQTDVNDVITEITKLDAPKVDNTKIVVGKKPVKNEIAEEKKKREAREAREAEARRIEDEKKAGNPKTFTYKAKNGDVYNTLATYAKEKCGKEVSMERWNPKIANAQSVQAGTTYTCTCPE